MKTPSWSSGRRSAALRGLGRVRGGGTEAVFMEEPMDSSLDPEESQRGPEGRVGVVKPAGSSGDRGRISGEPPDWLQRVTLM